MWPYSWTHVGTPSHLGHMDRVAATMPSQAQAGAAQEAPNIGQWEGQDVPLVRPSSCIVKGGIPSSRRYLPTYLKAGQPSPTPLRGFTAPPEARPLTPRQIRVRLVQPGQQIHRLTRPQPACRAYAGRQIPAAAKPHANTRPTPAANPAPQGTTSLGTRRPDLQRDGTGVPLPATHPHHGAHPRQPRRQHPYESPPT